MTSRLMLAVMFSVGMAAAARTEQPEAILGRWAGTSTCIKQDWNTACNDERVVYWITKSETSTGAVTLHAYKYVGSSLESMGDLEAAYDATRKAWVAPFSNARVTIEWVFQPLGKTITGRLIDLKTARIARTAMFRRDTIQTAPPR